MGWLNSPVVILQCLCNVEASLEIEINGFRVADLHMEIRFSHILPASRIVQGKLQQK